MSPVGRMISLPPPTRLSSTSTSPLSSSDQGVVPDASVYSTEPLTVSVDLPPVGRALTPTTPFSLNGGGVTHTPTPTLVRYTPDASGRDVPRLSANPPRFASEPPATPPNAASLGLD